jgi:proto-chlorophyllide reductase subunit
MKFLCVGCDQVMEFAERQLPGDGTLIAVFRCPACAREMALLANPMETQLVSGLGVKVGGRTVPEQPFEVVTSALAEGRPEAFEENRAPSVRWSADAGERLQNVPSFVRGMVKRIYADYARERGIAEITPAVMDRARSDLGLEGM